ncbi:MAG: hypothetical protein QF902_02645 [Rhodospirillales bacterium]|jgi:hypothetical protein|nr:hypothetical protein [Rhodospirillales bacterium]
MRLGFADPIAPVGAGGVDADKLGEQPIHVRGTTENNADVMWCKNLSGLISEGGSRSPSSLRRFLENHPVAAAEHGFRGVFRDGRDE